tara:strand:+ start:297 stop:569 length:273 start_codon:yes stop_codon:yes gene_type:complete
LIGIDFSEIGKPAALRCLGQDRNHLLAADNVVHARGPIRDSKKSNACVGIMNAIGDQIELGAAANRSGHGQKLDPIADCPNWAIKVVTNT